MRTVRAAILLLTGMLLSGCFSDSTSDGEASIGPTDPTSGNGAPTTPPSATGFRPQFQPLLFESRLLLRQVPVLIGEVENILRRFGRSQVELR